MTSDADILASSTRNPDLFEEIVDRYEKAFIRKALAMLRNEDDAYDAVQETFVRIYAKADRFKKKDGASFSSWAYAILINRCRTIYRKRERRRLISFGLEPEYAEVIPDQAEYDRLEAKLTRDHILSVLSKLPAILRRVMTLHFIDGMPEKEIAEREGVSYGVIRTRIYRAKKQLKELVII